MGILRKRSRAPWASPRQAERALHLNRTRYVDTSAVKAAGPIRCRSRAGCASPATSGLYLNSITDLRTLPGTLSDQCRLLVEAENHPDRRDEQLVSG